MPLWEKALGRMNYESGSFGPGISITESSFFLWPPDASSHLPIICIWTSCMDFDLSLEQFLLRHLLIIVQNIYSGKEVFTAVFILHKTELKLTCFGWKLN